ncbi:unnamed protein product [Sphagnum tenellum]
MWRSVVWKLERAGRGRTDVHLSCLPKITQLQESATFVAANTEGFEKQGPLNAIPDARSNFPSKAPALCFQPPHFCTTFPQLDELLSQLGQSFPPNLTHGSVYTSEMPFMYGMKSAQARAYASVAMEAVESSDEEVEVHAVGDLLGTAELKVDPKMKKKRQKLYRRQVKVETEAWQQAAAEYREVIVDMCRKNLAPNLPFAQALLLGWFEPLRDGIIEEQKAYQRREQREDRSMYGPYLAQLPADMLAVITMHRLMGLLMSDMDNGSVKVVHAAIQIGEAVEQEVRIHQLMKKKKKHMELKTGGTERSLLSGKVITGQNVDITSDSMREKVKKLVKQNKLRRVDSILRHASTDEPWTAAIHVKVGSRLLELMMETSFVQPAADQECPDVLDLRPAFTHTLKSHHMRRNLNRTYGVIECDPLVMLEINQSVQHMVMPYMPMLVHPRPWLGFNEGGYLHLKSSIMRTQGTKEQRMAVMDTPRESMKKVMEALDILGGTSWRIRAPILDVVEKMWADGGGLANLVDANDVGLPEKPETEDMEEWRRWRFSASEAKRTNKERHSIRCDTEIKLAVARKLRDEEEFYYPHNVDFRGRAYPMHPHLNHLGSDMCRGLLEFAKGRPLGSTGLYWLKIHLANLCGGPVGKMSFERRVAYTDNHMDKIFDSAERPLSGLRWWLLAEDPFQCLAACMDIRDAILSGDPSTYVSFLPVHQDGSCNGLQHYAALGRDWDGAQSVNLTTGDQPADVYAGIAERVRLIMEKDVLKNPLTNRNAASAQLLNGQIDRKLVKQTVMTSVYGVTFVGAQIQILSRLKERGLLADSIDMYRAAAYAAKVTLDALGEMFKEARCIMVWLGDCAKIIASAGHTVKWTTPLGLPVVQPYRKDTRQLVKTSLQVLALRSSDENQPVLVSRQRTAFPPNFVHSLDSSHMMMTAITCKKVGLTFAGVHDSYWTHAGDVEQMNVMLRENFVELYEQPILENLLKGFQEQFPGLAFPDIPKRGDFDLKEVLKAPYFFN